MASFARFLMQLLAVGAPSDLVHDTQAAIADEIDHARRCFAIASAYAGQPVGPGPLPMDHALDGGNDLVAVAQAVIREGCVGETLAAAEVAECSQWAVHPEVRGALAAIAADELRHAALAWRFVQWALERATDLERAQILATLDVAIAQAQTVVPVAFGRGGAAERGHGILPLADRLMVRATALRTVVIPCARRLRVQWQADARAVA